MAYSLSSGQEIVQNDPFAGIEPQLKRIQLYTSPRLFDVFINHRGPDVKDTLALQLYNSLQEMELRAFLDSKEMELGDSIPSALKNAIRSASVHIAIFTRRYAYSPWCLAELTLMLQTRAKIIPVFYDVDPFDIRYIEKGVYADAFVENKKKGRYVDMLEEWKEVLRSVSFFSGYEFKKHNYDHNKLCKSVVSVVLKEVEKKKSIHVAKYTVKLEKLVEDFETWCDQEGEEKENTNIVGIFGMGGSGKTTLAKELYNCKRSEYNASCFLYDVREAFARNELLSLQNRLLKDLVLEDPPKFQSIEEGSNYLRQHLKRGSFWRFLIVIDDIDHEDQLDHLCLIDTLSAHSLVIVTTRDERLLKRAGISIRYKMKPMDREHSRELFCWHAFRRPDPPSGYGDLVERFVEECGGLPLSLQVLGSHVCGGTDKFYWQLVLDKVRKILPHDIKKKLKISFDSLDDEQKQIFMDISCFFIGKEETMAIRIWEGSGWSAMHSLQTLKDKCLVEDGLTNYWNGFEVEKKRHLRMHDHLRDMGRGMADELSYPHRLWRPRYLESLTFKGFQSILAETNGRCFHSIFDRSIGSYITYFLGNSDDRGQSSTSLLWLELDLYLVELANIPSWIPLQNLECLKIRHGHLEQLWQSYSQAPLRLKELHLYGVVLAEIANSLGMLNQLEKVVLNVTGIPIKVWSLLETLANLTSNLRSLVVRNAVCVGNLALNNIDETVSFRNEGSLVLMLFSIRGELALNNLGEFSMSNLEKIELSDQELVSNVIISGNYCPKLHSLRLDSMKNLIELNLKRVTTLKHLELWSCGKLSTLLGISSLSKLVTLDIDSCPEVQDLTCLAFLSCLEIITIDGCYKLKNITCIEQLEGLKRIHLSQADRAIQSCLHRLQRLPSEFTVVIERAINGATEALNANLFSDVIGAEAFNEIDVNENGEPVASLKTPHSLSAIIICTVIKRRDGKALEGYDPPVNSSDGLIPLKLHFSVNTHNRKQKKGEDSKESLLVIDEALSSIIGGGESLSVIDEGEWIVTIVITEEKVLFEISNDAQYFARYSDWTYFAWLLEKFNPTFCSIEKGCIVSVNKGEEWKTLYVLKILTAKLYKWS